MANQPYYPTSEGNQITWFTNIQSKITGYATELDISATRQTKINLCLTWLIWCWQTFLPARRHDGPVATRWRDSLATGIPDPAISAAPPAPATLTPPAGTAFFGMLSWLFGEIARWKKAEGYTDTIGHDLGVIGAANTQPDPNAIPEVRGEVCDAEVLLHFQKEGHEGVWIEGQVGDETVWSFLAIDTTNPYNDTRPLKVAGQPEKRRYRLCFWDGLPTNQWSNIIEVTFGG